MRRLDFPRRSVSAVEGEGLFNDATALVAYKVAVAAVVAGSFSLGDAGRAVRRGGRRRGRDRTGGRLGRSPRSAARDRDPQLEHHDLAVQRLRRVHSGERASAPRACSRPSRRASTWASAGRASFRRARACRGSSSGTCSTSSSTRPCSCSSGSSCGRLSRALTGYSVATLVGWARRDRRGGRGHPAHRGSSPCRT